MNKRKLSVVSRGFTVIELLIVIMIIAIIYSIASANVSGIQNEARISRINGDLKTLELALNSYIKRTGYCPPVENYQRALLQSVPRLLNSNLFDPFGATVNTMYPYTVSENNRFYVVYSIGMKRNGSSEVTNDGNVSITGSPIIETNGYQ